MVWYDVLQVSDAVFEAVEGDARSVLCEAVERHHAEMLVVGSHGYGAIKRSCPSHLSVLPLLFSPPLLQYIVQSCCHLHSSLIATTTTNEKAKLR
jgi:hypothetical protein